MFKKRTGNSGEMSFLQHLEVLRWHLIKSFLAIVVFAVVIFIYHTFVFDNIILAPKTADFISNRILCQVTQILDISGGCINDQSFQVISITMSGQFSMHIWVSIIGGFILAFPYVFWQVWSFIRPALRENEAKHTGGTVFTCSFLFLLGVLFGYYVILPFSINFLGAYYVSEQVLNQITLDSYISTVTSISLASGVVFELPVVIYFLSKFGLVTPAFLRRYRRHSIVVILILAAIITPPDMFSQILVSLPLWFLYEISIVVSARLEKRNKAREAAAQ